jgi:hypothetical protein
MFGDLMGNLEQQQVEMHKKNATNTCGNKSGRHHYKW